MEQLVKIIKNDVFTDSLVIAEGTGNEHESVATLIKKYETDFQEFGVVEFTDLKSGKRGRPTRVYQLNEPQATLLMTYLDNTKIVRDFKKRLVKQFYQMRTLLQQLHSPIWQDARSLTKEIRKKEGAAIQALVDYAFANGSKNAIRYFSSLSLLADKAAGIKPQQRDCAEVKALTQLYLIEDIIEHCIQQGIQQEQYYKDIYKACKARVEQFTAVAYLT